MCPLVYAMLMVYREVEKAPPKENEKDNNAFVVPSFPISLLSAHPFSHTVKKKAENVLYGVWF